MSRFRRAGPPVILALALFHFQTPLLAGPARTYLVLPFEDAAAEPARDWLREAMAISLGDYLLAAGQGVVSREDRLLAMDELNLPAGAPLTLATSIRIGRHLRSRSDGPKPDRVVVGRFSLDQGRISISTRALDLASNKAGSWKQVEGNLQELLRLQKSLAQTLLRGEAVPANHLGAASDDNLAGQAFPLLAYENYVRALIEPDAGRRQSLLRKAIQQSPGYPKASLQLARLLVRAGKRSEAEGLLGRISSEPAPFGAEYHALKGSLALDAGRLPEAEEEVRHSLALRETAEARILMGRLERSRGDLDAAREELRRAAELDPDSPDVEALRRLLDREKPPTR